MLQNIPRDKILDVVKQGPTFPAKIAKQIGAGGDTMLIGAILSTMISTGDVKVSTLKIGGSPLYYVPEDEPKLEGFIDHLNDKDRKTFKLLKEAKVLQDTEQDPLTRVSLRAIKDFAKIFEIQFQGQKILFWRYYAVDQDEAESLAKGVVKKVELDRVEREPQRVEVKQETRPEPRPKQIIEPKLEPKSEPKPAVVETHAAHVVEVQAILDENKPSSSQDKPLAHVHEHEVKHTRAHAAHTHVEHEHTAHHEKSEKPKAHQSKEPKAPKVPKEPKPKTPKVEYDFYTLILNHVTSLGLDIISKEKIKKSEYDLILKNHNTNEYIYCKAKDKPSVSEGDLAPAMIFAQSKKMPCLFMTTGELTKKAESMLGKELSALKFERIIISANKISGE